MRHFLREPPINRFSGNTTPFLHDLLNNYISLCDHSVGVSSSTCLNLYEAERVSVLLTIKTLVLSTESLEYNRSCGYDHSDYVNKWMNE